MGESETNAPLFRKRVGMVNADKCVSVHIPPSSSLVFPHPHAHIFLYSLLSFHPPISPQIHFLPFLPPHFPHVYMMTDPINAFYPHLLGQSSSFSSILIISSSFRQSSYSPSPSPHSPLPPAPSSFYSPPPTLPRPPHPIIFLLLLIYLFLFLLIAILVLFHRIVNRRNPVQLMILRHLVRYNDNRGIHRHTETHGQTYRQRYILASGIRTQRGK